MVFQVVINGQYNIKMHFPVCYFSHNVINFLECYYNITYYCWNIEEILAANRMNNGQFHKIKKKTWKKYIFQNLIIVFKPNAICVCNHCFLKVTQQMAFANSLYKQSLSGLHHFSQKNQLKFQNKRNILGKAI